MKIFDFIQWCTCGYNNIPVPIFYSVFAIRPRFVLSDKISLFAGAFRSNGNTHFVGYTDADSSVISFGGSSFGLPINVRFVSIYEYSAVWTGFRSSNFNIYTFFLYHIFSRYHRINFEYYDIFLPPIVLLFRVCPQ